MKGLLTYSDELTSAENAALLEPPFKPEPPLTEERVKLAFWNYLLNGYMVTFANTMQKKGRDDAYQAMVDYMAVVEAREYGVEQMDEVVGECVAIYRRFVKTQNKMSENFYL